ncbi:phage resistance protein [Staphylococcus hsinchuensis]|uniref:Phage resistance protein n=1 Tax=Staphylococcus hsinchuensis TaxID=3051183 RepID=A0ABZ3EDA1_9STAP
MDEVSLYKKHVKFHQTLDNVDSPNLSKIKEISKRIHFASISSEKQIFNNLGNVYHTEKSDYGDYISNLTIDYIIIPKNIGCVYGQVNTKNVEQDGNDEKKATFKNSRFNNYARFIVDLMTHKVVFSKVLQCFVIAKNNTYEKVDETSFLLNYPVDKKHQIDDFLKIMIEIYQEHFSDEHDYKILQYSFAGNDWIYNCDSLEYKKHTPKPKELYALKYDVDKKDINTSIVKDFFDSFTDSEESKNNVRLLHAYAMFRKMNLIHAEKWFLLKDFGRTGKGLFIETLKKLLKVNRVNFDSLLAGGFEASNEWLKFYGTDVAHANETGEISPKMMRILRKIATGETITGRGIGSNSYKFDNSSVLILDTNESVDTGEITANTSRTVKIAFKDRPKDETVDERHKIFKPYWDFIKPNNENSEIASVSFLIASLEYLKEIGKEFIFNHVTLKNYFSEDDLTETQIVILQTLAKQGFIPAGDETLRPLIEEDYKNLKNKRAKEDMKKIGVVVNKQKKIEGINAKVHLIGNPVLFNLALKLLKES